MQPTDQEIITKLDLFIAMYHSFEYADSVVVRNQQMVTVMRKILELTNPESLRLSFASLQTKMTMFKNQLELTLASLQVAGVITKDPEVGDILVVKGIHEQYQNYVDTGDLLEDRMPETPEPEIKLTSLEYQILDYIGDRSRKTAVFFKDLRKQFIDSGEAVADACMRLKHFKLISTSHNSDDMSLIELTPDGRDALLPWLLIKNTQSILSKPVKKESPNEFNLSLTEYAILDCVWTKSGDTPILFKEIYKELTEHKDNFAQGVLRLLSLNLMEWSSSERITGDVCTVSHLNITPDGIHELSMWRDIKQMEFITNRGKAIMEKTSSKKTSPHLKCVVIVLVVVAFVLGVIIASNM